MPCADRETLPALHREPSSTRMSRCPDATPRHRGHAHSRRRPSSHASLHVRCCSTPASTAVDCHRHETPTALALLATTTRLGCSPRAWASDLRRDDEESTSPRGRCRDTTSLRQVPVRDSPTESPPLPSDDHQLSRNRPCVCCARAHRHSADGRSLSTTAKTPCASCVWRTPTA